MTSILGVCTEQLIREVNTFLWPSRGDLKAECESEIIAAQDQALQTQTPCNKNTANRNR